MVKVKVLLAFMAVGALLMALILYAPLANSQPNCPWVSSVWYEQCSYYPPIEGITQGWLPVDGVPGTYGPHGYTPIQD